MDDELSKATLYQPRICSVDLEYKSQRGTGAIIVLLIEGTWHTLFMTSYQVAPLMDSNDVKNLKLVFKEVPNESVFFSENWIVSGTLWISPADKLNVTAFELSPKANKILNSSKFSRLLLSFSLEKQKIVDFKYSSTKSEQNVKANSISRKNSAVTGISQRKLSLSAEIKPQNNVCQNKLTYDQMIEVYNHSMIRKLQNSDWDEQLKIIQKNKLQKIGFGVFGEVFKIIDKNDDFYALKLVEKNGAIDNHKIQVSALENEYKLITSFELYHPRIVQFFKLVRDGNEAREIIVMEYLAGGSLADKIKSKGCLDKVYSLKYLTQIMEAVEFLHKQKIVHRDIQPDNVLLTINDDIKLCDFCIAVHEDSEKKSGVGENNLGNLMYSSPERLSENASGPENDIWSVGATFVTMISGHTLNYNESFPEYKISQFKIFINSISLENFLKELPENDYKRDIISRTLCPRPKRSNARELLDLCENLKIIPSSDQHIAPASTSAYISNLSFSDELQAIRPRDCLDYQFTILKVTFYTRSGTGAIYGYEFPKDTWRTLFITSFEVLKIFDAEEIADLKVEFKDGSYLPFTPDWVQRFWTSPKDELNVAVIELSPIAIKYLSTTHYARLISSTPIENASLIVHDYNNRKTIGNIIDVNGAIITFKADTPEGNAGVPLLSEDLDVIGIHTEKWDTSNDIDKAVRKAININSIFKAYSEYILEDLRGKTENELYLEQISKIPRNELKRILIGKGSFGKVYKIKFQIDLAAKIVKKERVIDFARQEKALRKEFGILTSLDNHPRIIKLFALINDELDNRLMLIMEYLEGGSLEDKLKFRMSDYKAHKYLMQILEGVEFLHKRNIFHGDIKPANILFTTQDNLKVCDLGLSVKIQSDSSSLTSRRKGIVRYRSPEQLNEQNNAKRNAEDDIWSIGAIYVKMITGSYLNHLVPRYRAEYDISQYTIFIDGLSRNEYIQSLRDEFKKTIIAKTLCPVLERAKCEELLLITAQSFSRAYTHLNQYSQRISKQSLKLNKESDQYDQDKWGICYNSARDELFFADYKENVVRAIRLRDNSGDVRDVYTASGKLYSVCHISDSDTLLVCSNEQSKYCLVALSRSEDGCEWREAQRVEPKTSEKGSALIACALSNSRVLVGKANSKYMELFRVEGGPPLGFKSVKGITITEEYTNFSASSGSDIFVAISCATNTGYSVRVHRLFENQLKEIARIELKSPINEEQHLLWIDDRLLATEWDSEPNSNSITELEVNNTYLERRHTVLLSGVGIHVHRWCPVDEGLVIFDRKSRDILHYEFKKHM